MTRHMNNLFYMHKTVDFLDKRVVATLPTDIGIEMVATITESRDMTVHKSDTTTLEIHKQKVLLTNHILFKFQRKQKEKCRRIHWQKIGTNGTGPTGDNRPRST